MRAKNTSPKFPPSRSSKPLLNFLHNSQPLPEGLKIKTHPFPDSPLSFSIYNLEASIEKESRRPLPKSIDVITSIPEVSSFFLVWSGVVLLSLR